MSKKSDLLIVLLVLVSPGQAAVPPVLVLAEPAQVQWEGPLGRAIDLSYEKRLKEFIRDETSAPVALFSEARSAQNTAGRYWGEHAGKWLVTASRAAVRTGDVELAARVRRVADYLVSTQRPDGYIGTYPEEWRFMNRQQELPRGKWDVWVTACLMNGLLEVNRHFPDARYVESVRRLADLCWHTFAERGVEITRLGLFSGICATILLEPVADLYTLTGEPRYLDLARLIISRADARPEFGLVQKSLAAADVQTIAEGKAYELCWQYSGVIRLYRATGDEQYLRMVENVWKDIWQRHLTLGGGPWGGVGVHREVFNRADFFSPYGYVETCSVMAWMHLNSELLSLTGRAVYAEELEKSAYNSLLTAQHENGADWCYYTFPNGRRTSTGEWMCCKSSGAMALEKIGAVTYMPRGEREIAVNLYGPNHASIPLASAGVVRLRQQTSYPFAGGVRLAVDPEHIAEFVVALRIPSWAAGATVKVNGQPVSVAIVPGDYARIVRTWREGDEIVVDLPMRPVLHRQSTQSAQDTNRQNEAGRIMQTVVRYDYIAITRGPLVYATGLIDGFKQQETLRLPDEGEPQVEEIPPVAGEGSTGVRLVLGYREPLVFHPYCETGGRRDGAWALTWMQVTAPPGSGF